MDVSLALDRKAFIDILVEGQGLIGGVMQPPPDGIWGLPVDKLSASEAS
jgi:peptide/nickel transport system substrate-binding protein